MEFRFKRPLWFLFNILLFGGLILYLADHLRGHWPNMAIWYLPDSDDVTRVMEVRNWLNGQGFYDLLLHRSNPPFGGEMHWSRVSDAPLAFMQLVFRLFYSNELAEKYAVFYTPLVLWAIFGIIAAYTSYSLFKSKISFLSAVIYAVFTDSVMFDYVPGRVDHHGLQLITYFLLLMGIFRADKLGGLIAGIALAMSLTIGFELLPLQLIALAGLIIIWMLNPNPRKDQIMMFALGLGFGILTGFFINVAPHDYFNGQNDRLSVAQTVPIITGSIGLWLVTNNFSQAAISKRVLALFAIAIAVIISALPFPILLKPLYWQIDPFHYKLWMSDVGETFPATKFPASMQFTILTFLLVSLFGGAARLLWLVMDFGNHRDVKSLENWALLIASMLVAVLMTIFFQVRVHIHAAALSILICAALSAVIIKRKNIFLGLFGLAFVVLVFNPATIRIAKKQIFKPTNKPPTNKTYAFGGQIRCRAEPHFAHIAKEPKGLILTNINLGAEMMFFTEHDVITTHFHRDMGRLTTFDIFLSKPDAAYSKLKAKGINYVAFCSRAMEGVRLQQYDPQNLMGQLRIGKPPPYLELIPKPENSDIDAYRVK